MPSLACLRAQLGLELLADHSGISLLCLAALSSPLPVLSFFTLSLGSSCIKGSFVAHCNHITKSIGFPSTPAPFLAQPRVRLNAPCTFSLFLFFSSSPSLCNLPWKVLGDPLALHHFYSNFFISVSAYCFYRRDSASSLKPLISELLPWNTSSPPLPHPHVPHHCQSARIRETCPALDLPLLFPCSTRNWLASLYHCQKS